MPQSGGKRRITYRMANMFKLQRISSENFLVVVSEIRCHSNLYTEIIFTNELQLFHIFCVSLCEQTDKISGTATVLVR